jgi:hypothetical protein
VTIAEQVSQLLAMDYWRTAGLQEVRMGITREGYAASKLPLAERIVELVLNEASLHERLTASQAVLDRKDAARGSHEKDALPRLRWRAPQLQEPVERGLDNPRSARARRNRVAAEGQAAI